MTTFSSSYFLTSTSSSATLRNWYESPGMDGSFWVCPFYQKCDWITTGSLVTTLRNGTFGSPTGFVNVKGNFAIPWVVGRASDPLIPITVGTKTINVRIPVGTITEEPTGTSTDSSLGGCDVSQPYLLWCVNGATINTGSIQSTGSTISGTYGLQVDDGSGIVMNDIETGQPGTNNALGAIQDFDLSQINASTSYVIPHMLPFSTDPSMVSRSLVWPLKVADTSFSNTGSIPQGITIGIPSTTTRPTGKSRGFYALFDNLQQFGWFWYNVAGNGCSSISVYSTNSANASLVTDISNSISEVMGYTAILNYASGITGAQYSLATVKGQTAGAVLQYPAPPPLDLSPSNHLNVAPSTFGAWYPSGYNATPTNTIT